MTEAIKEAQERIEAEIDGLEEILLHLDDLEDSVAILEGEDWVKDVHIEKKSGYHSKHDDDYLSFSVSTRKISGHLNHLMDTFSNPNVKTHKKDGQTLYTCTFRVELE